MHLINIADRLSKLPPGMAEQNVQSWQKIAAFYERLCQDIGWEFLKPMKELVRKLAESEQAQFFRAGVSLVILMISTADKYGLEEGQLFIQVTLERPGSWQIQSCLHGVRRKVVDQRAVESGEDIFTALLPFLDWLWDATHGESK